MNPAQRSAEREGRRIELQLDPAQIVLVLAALVGLCAAAFSLGRWIERDRWSAQPGAANRREALREADAGADLTFFDALGGSRGPAPEPGRQVRSGAQTPAPGTSAEAAAAGSSERARIQEPAAERATPSAGSGGYAVQVFAGDRAQAETIAAALRGKGYAPRVTPTAPGASTARVRLHGFASRSDADRAADRVKKEQRLNSWVVKAD